MGPGMERLVIVVDLALLRCSLAHRRWHLYPRRHHLAATEPGLAVHLVGIKCREGPTMVVLSDLADDERTARMVLSMLVEPNDPVTGRVMNGLGAMETLRLAERDGAVVGLSAVDAQIWRDHFDAPAAKDIAARLDQAQQSGIQVLVPGDVSWPVALNDLGDLAPYVLWTRGASSFLSRPLQDFVTITGSRASTSYGDHVARELAASTAADERVVVAGGAYGIEGAAHQAALAAGGD